MHNPIYQQTTDVTLRWQRLAEWSCCSWPWVLHRGQSGDLIGSQATDPISSLAIDLKSDWLQATDRISDWLQAIDLIGAQTTNFISDWLQATVLYLIGSWHLI